LHFALKKYGGFVFYRYTIATAINFIAMPARKISTLDSLIIAIAATHVSVWKKSDTFLG